MIIDPPSPFAPTYEWEEFLAEVKAIRPQNEDTRRAVEQAEAEIKRRRNLTPAA